MRKVCEVTEALKKQVGGFNHRVVALVAIMLKREWLMRGEVYFNW